MKMVIWVWVLGIIGWKKGEHKYQKVMIQPQTLVQIYIVQTDVALIYWLNENIKNKNKSCGPSNI